MADPTPSLPPRDHFDEEQIPPPMREKIFRAARQVMRGTQTTDVLVIPLFAGVLAHLVLANPESPDPMTAAEHRAWATRLLALGRGASWHPEGLDHMRLLNLIARWPEFAEWYPDDYVEQCLPVTPQRTSGVLVDAYVTWLRETQHHWVDVVLLGAAVATRVADKGKDEPFIKQKSFRRARVVLAEQLKLAGANAWPAVLTAAVTAWDQAYVEGLALRSGRLIRQVRLRARTEEQTLATALSSVTEELRRAKLDAEQIRQAKMAPQQALQATVAELQGELERERKRAQALREEHLRLIERHASAITRAERAERRLTDMTLSAGPSASASPPGPLSDVTPQGPGAAAEGDGVSQVPSNIAIPQDIFAGRTIFVFTNTPRGGERERIQAAFQALGCATVEMYEPDRANGPLTFPSDALIVLDTARMGHSQYYALKGRARRSGCWYFEGAYNATLLAHMVAERWVQYLAAMT